MKKIVLTGDRPTGKLHLGHYIGSLKNRVKMQQSDNYEIFIMIADTQALTDNFDNPIKIKENIHEVLLDYLSIGLDPNKVNIFIQSEIPELFELTVYYMNLVPVSRLQRNPTIKSELELRGFKNSIPAGFLCYPISQAADITAFDAEIVPAGEDQIPLIEQTKEIVRKFNFIYSDILVEPKILLPNKNEERRLVGIDGNAKMSKSLNNAIYLSDSEDELKRKVMSAYTDPNHIHINDPGNVEGNVVFKYLDVFVKNDSFEKFYPEFHNLDELKKAYEKGGIGDKKIKVFLFNVLNELLKPIREKRKYLSNNPEELNRILFEGSKHARKRVKEKLNQVRRAIGLDYFIEK